MAIAVEIQLPGVTAEQYEQMLGALGPSMAQTSGFLAHAGGPITGGWRIAEIWNSEKEFAQFTQDKVAPLAKATGMSVPTPRIEPLHRLLTPVLGTEGTPVAIGPVGPN